MGPARRVHENRSLLGTGDGVLIRAVIVLSLHAAAEILAGVLNYWVAPSAPAPPLGCLVRNLNTSGTGRSKHQASSPATALKTHEAKEALAFSITLEGPIILL